MTRRSLVSAVAAAGALTALPASPAAASDETLKAEVEVVLVEVRPALEEFRAAADELADASDTTRLQEATQGVRRAVSRYKWGVVNRKASTPEGLTIRRRAPRTRPRP